MARRTRWFAGLGVAVAAVAVGALVVPWAFGYWSGSGTGAGGAGTGTEVPLTLTAATPTSAVYPGASSDVAVTVGNPSPAVLELASLVLDTSQGTGGFAVDAGHAGCDVSVLGFTSQTNNGAGWSVPARSGGVNGSLTLTLSGALSMTTSAVNACQGATFTVYLTAGA
jgi:hypothetical protein